MKVLLVFNSYAGHGRAGKILPQVEAAFSDNGIEFDLQITNYPGHGIEITRNADFGMYDGLIAAGGLQDHQVRGGRGQTGDQIGQALGVGGAAKGLFLRQEMNVQVRLADIDTGDTRHVTVPSLRMRAL